MAFMLFVKSKGGRGCWLAEINMLNKGTGMMESNLAVMGHLKCIMANSTSNNKVLSYSGYLIRRTCDICKEVIQPGKIWQPIKKTLNNRGIVHAGFILSTAVIILLGVKYYFDNLNNGIGRQGYISILYFFVCVYTGRWICKTWFLKNKLISFSIFSIIGFIVLLYGGKLILNALLPLNQKNIDEFFFAITPLFIAGMLTGIFVPLIRALLQKQLMEANKMAAQKQGELNLLQSQLSPHFLFNTLNNLYGISITQHEKIPNLLLKLSELLRYSVYETRQPFIPLGEEVKYISNYISFEELRIGERLNLKTEIEETDNRQIKIAPMLLIVFIENAFKHAKNSFDKTIFICISLTIIDEYIKFFVSNSCDGLNVDKSVNKDGGFGLDNVKKRLELLYANEYTLKAEKLENSYSVTLELKAK